MLPAGWCTSLRARSSGPPYTRFQWIECFWIPGSSTGLTFFWQSLGRKRFGMLFIRDLGRAVLCWCLGQWRNHSGAGPDDSAPMWKGEGRHIFAGAGSPHSFGYVHHLCLAGEESLGFCRTMSAAPRRQKVPIFRCLTV